MNKTNINFIIIKYLYDNNYLNNLTNVELTILKNNIINESDLLTINNSLDLLFNELLEIDTKDILKDILVSYLYTNIFFNESDSLTTQIKNIEYVFNESYKINFDSYRLKHIIINESVIYTTYFNFDNIDKYNTITIKDYKKELLDTLDNLELEDLILIIESIL